MLNIQQKMKVIGNLSTRELTSTVLELYDRMESLENTIKELQKNFGKEVQIVIYYEYGRNFSHF